jgi:hypothetical protein
LSFECLVDTFAAMIDVQAMKPTMRDLMATVGEVLLMWGFLEAAMRERLASRPASAEPDAKISTFARWRTAEEQAKGDSDPALINLIAEIKEVAQIRHCLAHGLSSASADPRSDKQAEVGCVMLDGTRRRFTITEMQEAKDQLHALTSRVYDLPL